MNYVITGLPVEQFQPLFGLSDAALAERHIVRMTAESPDSYPCRVLLADAQPGETLLLLNYEYQPAETPYRARHAIFVNEAATAPRRFENEMPRILTQRKAISLRAFDASDMMIDADIVPGAEVENLALKLLENPETAYLHAHFAGRGCFAARIDRL
jgi:hypothetical protein